MRGVIAIVILVMLGQNTSQHFHLRRDRLGNRLCLLRNTCKLRSIREKFWKSNAAPAKWHPPTAGWSIYWCNDKPAAIFLASHRFDGSVSCSFTGLPCALANKANCDWLFRATPP
jgi:hypothetical protein